MPKFHVYYDVRHYNGDMVIEAKNKKEAEEVFNGLSVGELLVATNDVAVDVEDVYEEKP
jgi:hypothetical protein